MSTGGILSLGVEIVMASSNSGFSGGGPLRLALFGAGRHAEHHARAILRYAGAKLVAEADTLDIAWHDAKQCCE